MGKGIRLEMVISFQVDQLLAVMIKYIHSGNLDLVFHPGEPSGIQNY